MGPPHRRKVSLLLPPLAGIGQGQKNTDDLSGFENTAVLAQNTQSSQGAPFVAAQYCQSLRFGGFSDWFLPNRYELNLLYMQKDKIKKSTNDLNTYYWSSTEYSQTLAWVQDFSSGEQDATAKNQKSKVRCFRKF